jgi:hypothetical protein
VSHGVKPSNAKHATGAKSMPLITVSAGTPALEAGTYPATLVGIAPKTLVTKFSKNGEEQDFLEWTWLVEGSDKDIEINSLTTLMTGPKSRIFEYLLALVGPEKARVGAGFDENDLVGKKVLVTTIVDDNGFAKIERIVAAPKGRQAAAQAAPKERAPQPPATEDDDLPF